MLTDIYIRKTRFVEVNENMAEAMNTLVQFLQSRPRSVLADAVSSVGIEFGESPHQVVLVQSELARVAVAIFCFLHDIPDSELPQPIQDAIQRIVAPNASKIVQNYCAMGRRTKG